MSSLLGTQIAAAIVPFDSEDTYATHEDTYGKGGWRSVVDITERDSIPQERRKIGMAVYVQSEGQIYVLKDGTSNLNWVNFNPGGSSSTYIHNQGISSAVWIIAHNMNKYPAVTVVDSAENQVIGDLEYIDANRVMVTFKGAFKGKAYCN
jgi:hypothetical protein